MVTKRKKIVETEGIALPKGNIADIEDSYNYPGSPQAARKAGQCWTEGQHRGIKLVFLNNNRRIDSLMLWTADKSKRKNLKVHVMQHVSQNFSKKIYINEQ